MNIKVTRIPGRFAVTVELGDHKPFYLEAREVDQLETQLSDAYIKMIGDGYAGFHANPFD